MSTGCNHDTESIYYLVFVILATVKYELRKWNTNRIRVYINNYVQDPYNLFLQHEVTLPTKYEATVHYLYIRLDGRFHFFN
jgi:hypothetical protein